MTEVIWHGIETPSIERCRLMEGTEGVEVRSRFETANVVCEYLLTASPTWAFRTLTLTVGETALEVVRDAAGWSVDGAARPDLSKAHEVDIAISPLSNTLPIRRLGLDIGQSADIVTAYVTVPGLSVTTDPQRYTRVSEDQFLYESRDSDFRRTVDVDADGLVLTYPGLFQRGVAESRAR